MSKPKVLIGVPAYNGVVPEAMDSFLSMIFRCGRDLPQYDFAVKILTKREQWRARNALVDAAIGGDFEWLLMLDDDMLVPHDLLARLLAHNKDIVGGLYYQRGGAYHPVVLHRILHEHGAMSTLFYSHDDPIFKAPGLHQVDIIGGGCMLFRVDVFRKLLPPYFEWERVLGTDIGICSRFLDAGVSIYIDTSMELGHLRDEKQVVTSRTVPLATRAFGAINETLWEDALDYLCMLPEQLSSAVAQASLRETRNQKWFSEDRSTWEGVRAFYQQYGAWHIHNLLYHNMYNSEPTKEWALLYSEAAVGRGATLIDYGCGLGHLTIPLCERFGHRIHAMDIAGAPTLDFLRYRIRKHACDIKVDRHKGVMVHEIVAPVPEVDLPAPADGALVISMIEHCWDAEGAIAWLARNIRPGGFLVCSYAVERMEEEPQHLIRYDVTRFGHLMAQQGFVVSPEWEWLFLKR